MLPQGRLLVVYEFFVEDLLELNEKPPACTLALVRIPANKQIELIRTQLIRFKLLAPAIFI
jgi:hypothetical protein